MGLEEGLVAHLMADSDVTDLISTRLYPMVIPQDASLPAAAYQIITDMEEHTHDGPSGLVEARVQFTFHGSTYSAAKGICAAVRGSIDGFSGTMDGVAVNAVESEAARDGWSEAHGRLPVVRQDFRIWYQR